MTENSENPLLAEQQCAIPLRPPETVMRLDRMGSAHPTRLSFLRLLLRRMKKENWRFDRPYWQVDDNGEGRAVYRAKGPERTYCLVAFAHNIPDGERSDRVIATMWDATFTLFDGEPTAADLSRLEKNVPLQEAGRISSRELSLSRANRSVRLFKYVVDALASGVQPDPAEIDRVGYLMRTTAVYGSGKFGAQDRMAIAERPELNPPFQIEMLSVWLTRWFCVDIVEHMATVKGGDRAVGLDPRIKRCLGVGNSTGLGMAPFIIRHPMLLNNWMVARETALARVRSLENAKPGEVKQLREAFGAARANLAHWRSDNSLQKKKLADLAGDFNRLNGYLETWPGEAETPWDALWRWGEEHLSLEGQEALLSILLEPHGELIGELAEQLCADEAVGFHIDGSMSVGAMRKILHTHYCWALEIDFTKHENTAHFWYVAEEKLEPRLGDREWDEGAEREQPLCIGRYASDLYEALINRSDTEPIAAFLLAHPEHRFMVRRAQLIKTHPYGEIQDNLICKTMLPIDLMRCKLACFGASRFDPRSDRWVRISLFQDMPYPEELQEVGDE